MEKLKYQVLKNPNIVTSEEPICALEIEEVVLGSCIMERGALLAIRSILDPQKFFRLSHRLIYKALCSLFDRGLPIDPRLVCEELKKQGNLEKLRRYLTKTIMDFSPTNKHWIQTFSTFFRKICFQKIKKSYCSLKYIK